MIQKFYIVDDPTDESVGNVYPQLKDMRPGYKMYEKTSISELDPFKEPEVAPDLDYCVINNKTKLTDFLSTGHFGEPRLISEKAQAALKNLWLPRHFIYPARILYRKKFYDNYSLLHFVGFQDDLLDIPNCVFRTKHISGLKFNSREELSEYRKSIFSDHVLVRLEKAKLIEDKYYQQDSFDFVSYARIVSQNFVEQYEKNGLTGLKFKETDLFA